MRVKARVYIDSTGDGDLAALAGAPFEVGGQDFAGLNMSTTQGSRWAGANLRVYEAAEEAFRKEQVEQGVENPLPLVYVLEEEAIKRGEMSRHVCNRSKGFFRVLIPNTPDEDAEFVTFSFHSYYCHNTDAEDISASDSRTASTHEAVPCISEEQRAGLRESAPYRYGLPARSAR